MNKLDIIVYIFLLSIIVWVIGKSTGLINSPTIIELYPYIALAIGGGIGYTELRTNQKHILKATNKLPFITDKLLDF